MQHLALRTIARYTLSGHYKLSQPGAVGALKTSALIGIVGS
jgi:hypothetical protein